MLDEALKTYTEEIERDEQNPPPSLLDILPYSILRGKPINRRPPADGFTEWGKTQLREERSGDIGKIRLNDHRRILIDYYLEELVYPLVGSFITRAKETTDTESPAEKYYPIDDEWVDKFYNQPDRKILSGTRDKLLSEKTKHNFQNSLLIVVDQQVAFGAQPGLSAAQKAIQERSFGEANLEQIAKFARKVIDLGPWVVLTTMQHDGRTTVDRWKQQRNLGLVNSEGDFLLCSEGSSDVMIHPLFLERLGLTPKEITWYEYELLTHALSCEVGRVFSPGENLHSLRRKSRLFSLGDYLPVIVKPERGFDGENLRQIMCVGPSDIFLAGADIHVCLAKIVEQLKLGWGYKPNIWIIYDLSTTRPGDFEVAKETVVRLADYNHYIYLVSQAQAEKLLGRNKITVEDRNQPHSPFPTLEGVIRTKLTNYSQILAYTENVLEGWHL